MICRENRYSAFFDAIYVEAGASKLAAVSAYG
jgi:hypothetical protein